VLQAASFVFSVGLTGNSFDAGHSAWPKPAIGSQLLASGASLGVHVVGSLHGGSGKGLTTTGGAEQSRPLQSGDGRGESGADVAATGGAHQVADAR